MLSRDEFTRRRMIDAGVLRPRPEPGEFYPEGELTPIQLSPGTPVFRIDRNADPNPHAFKASKFGQLRKLAGKGVL